MNALIEKEALTLLQEALGLPEDSRQAHIKSRCLGRDQLRNRVEALLADSDESKPFPVFQLARSDRATGPAFSQDLQLFPTAETHGEDAATIGPYRLLGILGEGGMGVVYRAEQRKPQRTVALKVIRPRYLNSSGFQRRFEREVELLGRLDHPGIARIFDAGAAEVDGVLVPYIAMEFVEGVPLLQHVATACPLFTDKLALIGQIADAVHSAHQKGVVHRDLKPGNILVTKAGQPKVLDFGIATSTEMDVDEVQRTQAGELLGTLAYMSPEQARCESKQIDARSDIYTLGLIGFEVLAGRPAFEHFGGAINVVLQRIERGEPTLLGNINRKFRGDIEAIFSKACRSEPSERYKSAADLAADIERYRSDRPVEARAPSRLYELRKFARRNRFAVGALLALILILLVSGYRSQQGYIQAANRAAELAEVTDFQASRMSAVDVEGMGRHLRAELLGNARDTLQRRSGTGDVQAKYEELEGLLAGVDFPGISLRILDEAVIEPSIKVIDSKFRSQPNVQSMLLQSTASTLRQLGLFSKAAPVQQRALELRTAKLGEEHENTLISMTGAGFLLLDNGDYEQAQGTMERVLEVRRRILGKEHPETLNALSNVAVTLQAQGDFEGARLYLEEALAGWQLVRAEESSDTFETMLNLASALHSLEDYEGALASNEQALVGLQRTLGPEHPSTLRAMNNLATTLGEQGEWDKARQFLEQALEVERRTRGDEHLSTLSTMLNLSVAIRNQGDTDQARAYEEQVLVTCQRVLEKDHPQTEAAMNVLVTTHEEMGDLAGAQKYQEQVVSRRRRVLGEEHVDTLTAVHNLGLILKNQGNFTGARVHMEHVYEVRHRLRGEGNPATLSALSNLASMVELLGDLPQAQALQEQALEGMRIVLGEEDPETLEVMNILAQIAYRLGDPAKARVYAEPVLEAQLRVPGIEDPITLLTMNNLVRFRIADGDLDAARELLIRALEVARRVLDEDHPTLDGLEYKTTELGL